MNSPASMTVNSNVKIKVIDKYGKVVDERKIHNKATVNMVEGLLRFLCGDFNITKYNDSLDKVNNFEASNYIPSEIGFGTVGVLLEDRSTRTPRLSGIDYGQMKVPTFDESRLQQEIVNSLVAVDRPGQADKFSMKFDSISITSFDDPNNSMGLLLQKFIPAGKLVGRNTENSEGDLRREYFTDNLVGQGKGWVYFNPTSQKGEGEYEALFTELGLYSSSGILLARVLFDGKINMSDDGGFEYDDDSYINNPIVQSDTSSLVIEWRIGIVSIGQNDHIISGADLRNLGDPSGSSKVGDVVDG